VIDGGLNVRFAIGAADFYRPVSQTFSHVLNKTFS